MFLSCGFQNGKDVHGFGIGSSVCFVYNGAGELSDKQQAGLLETIAGKSRSNDIAALISNFSQVENAYSSAMNAEGSARKENEIYMTHIEARTKVLKANLQSLSNKTWQ